MSLVKASCYELRILSLNCRLFYRLLSHCSAIGPRFVTNREQKAHKWESCRPQTISIERVVAGRRSFCPLHQLSGDIPGTPRRLVSAIGNKRWTDYSPSTLHSAEYEVSSAPASRKYRVQNVLNAFHVCELRPAGDAPITYTLYPARGTTKPLVFARSIIFSGPAGKSAGMLKVADSFIMSEKIQIVFETVSELPLDPESSKALGCHRPPMMSVPAAVAESPADLDSKLAAS
jgi:hypothetical protein